MTSISTQSLFYVYCLFVAVVGQSLIVWEIGRWGLMRYYQQGPQNRRTRFAITLFLSTLIVGLIARQDFPKVSPKGTIILLVWLLALGFVSRQLLPPAQRLYQRAVFLHERAAGQYGDYHGRGISASFEKIRADGRLKEAEGLYLRAAELSRKSVRSELNVAIVHNQLGLLYRQQGMFEKAKEHLDESLRLVRQIEHLQPEDRDCLSALSMAFFRLAELHHVHSEYKKARELYQQSLAIDKKLGDRAGIDMNQRMLLEMDTAVSTVKADGSQNGWANGIHCTQRTIK